MVVQSKLVDSRSTPIQKVTVYNDRARVERMATVDVVAGTTQIVIQNLIPKLLTDSVTITARGAGDLHDYVISDFVEEKKYGAEAIELVQDMRKKEHELHKWTDELAILEGHKESVDGQLKMLHDHERERPVTTSTFENCEELRKVQREQSRAVREEMRDVKRKLADLRDEMGALKCKYELLMTAEKTKRISVKVTCSKNGPINLFYTYIITGASWKPEYEIFCNLDDKEMQIRYYGTVVQQTGEEWNSEQLILSTAMPAIGGSLPEMQKLVVRGQNTGDDDDDLVYAGGPPERKAVVRRKGSKKEEILPAAAIVHHHVLSTDYTIGHPTRIPSDTVDTKVSIGFVDVVPELVRESVPARTPYVFLTAKACNTSNLTLLPGNASISVDGEFVNKTAFPSVFPREDFTVSLGVDRAVRIEYPPAVEKTTKSGMLFKKTVLITHQQKVIVKNTKGEDLWVTVYETVPESLDSDIQVSLILPTVTEGKLGPTTPGSWINSQNYMVWTSKIPAHGQKELEVKWTVQHPSSMKLDYRKIGN